MDFADESYVRLFVRDTKTWLRLGFEGQCVLMFLLRKLDKAGVLDGMDDLHSDVSLVTGVPEAIVAAGMPRLLRWEVFQLNGNRLVMPNYLRAQNAIRTDKARQRDMREKRLAQARLVTPRDGAVTPRDESSREPTPDNGASRDVTLYCASLYSTEEQHRAPARVGANSEPEPPSSPTVTEIRRIGSEPYRSPAVVGSDVVKPEASSKLEPRSEFGGGTFPAEYIQYPKGWRWSAETESEALMQAVSRDDLQEHVNFWTTHKWSIPVTDLDGELRRNIPNIRTRRETNAAKAAAQRNRAPPAPAKPAKPAAEGMREWREREARLYEQEQQRRAEQRLKAQRCKT